MRVDLSRASLLSSSKHNIMLERDAHTHLTNTHAHRYDREAWPTPTVVVRETWSDGIDMSISFTAVDTDHVSTVNTSLDGWQGDGLIINVTIVNRTPRQPATLARQDTVSTLQEATQTLDINTAHSSRDATRAPHASSTHSLPSGATQALHSSTHSSPFDINVWIDFLGGVSGSASSNLTSVTELTSGGRVRLCAYSDTSQGIVAALQGAGGRSGHAANGTALGTVPAFRVANGSGINNASSVPLWAQTVAFNGPYPGQDEVMRCCLRRPLQWKYAPPSRPSRVPTPLMLHPLRTHRALLSRLTHAVTD
jgi:hypothetical protein